MEDLEEKLKQSQFKEYLAQSAYPSQNQFENRVERPYSVNTTPYSESFSAEYSIPPSPKPIQRPIANRFDKTTKSPLQVTYRDTKNLNTLKMDKKGHFNIMKKRKLYSEKEFLNQ